MAPTLMFSCFSPRSNSLSEYFSLVHLRIINSFKIWSKINLMYISHISSGMSVSQGPRFVFRPLILWSVIIITFSFDHSYPYIFLNFDLIPFFCFRLHASLHSHNFLFWSVSFIFNRSGCQCPFALARWRKDQLMLLVSRSMNNEFSIQLQVHRRKWIYPKFSCI